MNISRFLLPDDLLAAVSRVDLEDSVRAFSAVTRDSGSPGEEVAAEYIVRKLEEYGLEAGIHRFRSFLSHPREAGLAVVAPEQVTVTAITHSFSASTPPGGIEAELYWARGSGDGDFLKGHDRDDVFPRQAVQGKAVLVDGLIMPGLVRAAQEAGAVAIICANAADRLHEMIVTTVWGHPTPESAGRIPAIPAISIRRSDGEAIKTLLERGPVRVRVTARTETGWYELPLPWGEIRGAVHPDEFILVGGHYDAWHYGATDNATGNASILELARVLARHASRLERGVRFTWWPGHSTGRYAGSTWYADNCWEELNAGGVAYLNIDSPGVPGATVYFTMGMAELDPLVEATVRAVTGRGVTLTPAQKNADQSFWGLGITSTGIYPEMPPGAPGRGEIIGGSGGGWWWHTPDDLIEHVDFDLLVQDTRLYAAFVYNLARSTPVLPLDYRRTAVQIQSRVREIAAAAGDLFDLASVAARAGQFAAAASRLAGAIDRVVANRVDLAPARARAVDTCLLRVARIMNPVLYTIAGRYDQDPAVTTPLLPGLDRARYLAGLAPESNEFGFLLTRLVRERNRAVDALADASQELERAIALLEGGKEE